MKFDTHEIILFYSTSCVVYVVNILPLTYFDLYNKGGGANGYSVVHSFQYCLITLHPSNATNHILHEDMTMLHFYGFGISGALASSIAK